MVKIYVAEEDIRIVTPHETLIQSSNGNIDNAMCEVLKKHTDSNVEIISWSNRYKMIQKNPRNEVEEEISKILNARGVLHRKFTDDEWNEMKEQIKERVFRDAISKQEKKSDANKAKSRNPFD